MTLVESSIPVFENPRVTGKQSHESYKQLQCLELLCYENSPDKPLWPGEETFPPAGHSLAKCPSSPQLRQLLSKTAKVIA